MGVQVTRDEADKKREAVREERDRILAESPQDAGEAFSELQLDQTVIKNPQKGKSYHLANRVSKGGSRVNVLRGYGYQPTSEDSPAQLLYGEHKDGGQIIGELVLMETTKANYEKRRARKMAKHNSMLGEDQRLQVRENMNQILRDSGRGQPHKDATFDESGER